MKIGKFVDRRELERMEGEGGSAPRDVISTAGFLEALDDLGPAEEWPFATDYGPRQSPEVSEEMRPLLNRFLKPSD